MISDRTSRHLVALAIGLLLGCFVGYAATAHAQVFGPKADQHLVDQMDARIAALEARRDSAAQGIPTSKKEREARAQYARIVVTLDSLKAEHAKRMARLAAALAGDSAALDSVAGANSLGNLNPPQVPTLPVDSTKARLRHPTIFIAPALEIEPDSGVGLPVRFPVAPDGTTTPHATRRLHPLPYLALLDLGAEVGGRADHDRGGYDRQKFYASKFVMHVLGGCAVEQLAESAHVPRWIAVTGTIAAAIRFEYVQGYPNRRDMANGTAGALSCAAWSLAWR